MRGSSKSSSSSPWPKEAAAQALFYLPNILTDDPTPPACRLAYDESTHTIQIISEEREIIDWFSPDDVIGAKLEFQLDLEEKLNADLAKRLERTSLEEKEESRSSPNCGCSLSEEMEGVKKDWSTLLGSVAPGTNTATVKVYCYPRYTPSETRYFSSWRTSNNPSLPPQKGEKEQDKEHWGERYARHRTLEVAPCGDFANVLSVVRAIRKLAHVDFFLVEEDEKTKSSGIMQQRRDERQKLMLKNNNDESASKDQKGPPKYLVIVNPFSGKKTALSIYESITKPMLDECGIEHDLFLTDYAGHAYERMQFIPSKEGDILEYDGIVSMGGDGNLHEILQGIKAREDAEDVLKNVPFGVIGCGSSNGFAKTLLFPSKEHCNPLESTFYIAKGQTKPIDLSEHTVTSSNDITTLKSSPTKSYYGFLTFCWAFIADCDLESEVLRCLGIGGLRVDLWAVWRVINLRKYRARFSYLPPPSKSDETDNQSEEKKEGNIDGVLPLPTEDIPTNWKTIEDDFILVWCHQVTHAGSNAHSSPMSKLQDGVFQVMIIRYVYMHIL